MQLVCEFQHVAMTLTRVRGQTPCSAAFRFKASRYLPLFWTFFESEIAYSFVNEDVAVELSHAPLKAKHTHHDTQKQR
jgi:hypothetical protein